MREVGGQWPIVDKPMGGGNTGVCSVELLLMVEACLILGMCFRGSWRGLWVVHQGEFFIQSHERTTATV